MYAVFPVPCSALIVHDSLLAFVMRIRVIWEGKTKDRHLRAVQEDYISRISHFTEIVVDELQPVRSAASRTGKAMSATERRLMERLRESTKVLLDVRGCEWTSEDFAQWLGQQAVRGTRDIAFAVGGPEGFSAAFRKNANLLLALSRMTLTHDWARTLLLEQIYRGFTILRGYPYAR